MMIEQIGLEAYGYSYEVAEAFKKIIYYQQSTIVKTISSGRNDA